MSSCTDRKIFSAYLKLSGVDFILIFSNIWRQEYVIASDGGLRVRQRKEKGLFVAEQPFQAIFMEARAGVCQRSKISPASR